MYRTIVEFEIKEEALEEFREILKDSTDLTLSEKGCIAAGMYQDCQTPTKFRCIEDWESYEAMMGHLENKPSVPDPRDAFPFIKANMVGQEKFNFFRTFVAKRKDGKEA